MTTLAEVKMWGRTIGAVFMAAGEEVAVFEYDPAFAKSGIEIAPLVMPLSRKVYRFPELSRQTFYGLPGLLADSLPDRFGNALINAWLAAQGRQPSSFDAVERLCYTGTRGMGALEYAPATGPKGHHSDQIQVDKLVALASDILTQRDTLSVSFNSKDKENAVKDILQIGTSAGGARAKAVIAWNPSTNEVRSGQLPVEEGFEHWLLKFDGVSGNKDKESEDPGGYGLIEYAYAKMAADAGITINECRIFKENNRHHFMTRRFDRLSGNKKLHMQSLGALAHYDFNMAGAYSYEQTMLVIRQLGLPMSAIEEMFRRMVFNIIARNQDDHVKNIAFLMDQSGTWSLAPAYDLVYSFNPVGSWTKNHQMTVNGKQDNFTLEDLKVCARTASMKRGRAETIIREVRERVVRWRDYADEVGVHPSWRDHIQKTLRLNLPV